MPQRGEIKNPTRPETQNRDAATGGLSGGLEAVAFAPFLGKQ